MRATAAGNLPRAAVRDLIERYDPAARERYAFLHEYSKAVNEQDVGPVHSMRVVAKLAGLLWVRQKAFRITRKGESLLADARAGDLMVLLFRTYFRTFNIGYGGWSDTSEIQYLIPLILHRLRTTAEPWTEGRALAAAVLPPELIQRQPEEERAVVGPAGFVGIRCETSVFRPLVLFGLLESREIAETGDGIHRHEYRRTPLFERVLTFHLPTLGTPVSR